MARTPSVSDEEIFEAARGVIARCGPDAFTLAEVAEAVGLSRAAIILRFRSTQALKVALLSRLVEQFVAELDALPATSGADGLMAIASCIGQRVGSRRGSAGFFVRYGENVQDAELAALEQRRGAALRAKIMACMPAVSVSREDAAAAFSAHLTGSIVAWLGTDQADCRAYLRRRTRVWLRLTGMA